MVGTVTFCSFYPYLEVELSTLYRYMQVLGTVDS